MLIRQLIVAALAAGAACAAQADVIAATGSGSTPAVLSGWTGANGTDVLGSGVLASNLRLIGGLSYSEALKASGSDGATLADVLMGKASATVAQNTDGQTQLFYKQGIEGMYLLGSGHAVLAAMLGNGVSVVGASGGVTVSKGLTQLEATPPAASDLLAFGGLMAGGGGAVFGSGMGAGGGGLTMGTGGGGSTPGGGGAGSTMGGSGGWTMGGGSGGSTTGSGTGGAGTGGGLGGGVGGGTVQAGGGLGGIVISVPTPIDPLPGGVIGGGGNPGGNGAGGGVGGTGGTGGTGGLGGSTGGLGGTPGGVLPGGTPSGEVPEPSSIALMMAGLLGAGSLVRRRRS